MKKILPAILVLSASLLAAGCGDKEVEKVPPPAVKIVVAGKTAANNADKYPGVVKGRHESKLAFQTSGRILSRRVEKGSVVSAGDVLMTIDARDAVQQYNAGEAQVESARTQLNLAKTNYDRYEQLFRENAISAATLDQYRTNYENAVAAYNAAQAQAAQSENVLNYTNLTANAAGVVSDISAETGQVVSAGQTVLTLTGTDELEIEIDIPENKLAGVTVGQGADVTFWANKDSVAGTVREISPMADSTARTYRLRISLTNPPPDIRLGMTAEVVLKSPGQNVGKVILPLSAIYRTGDKTQVWVVTPENKATLKDVVVEEFSGNSVAVRGVSPQDKIVAAGVTKLSEGQEVRMTEAAK